MTLERLMERPVDGHGVPIGEGDWAFVVEVLLAESDDSLWGVATWNDGVDGDGIWSELAWVDVTPKVRGISWSRGSDQFGGRPTTGTAEVTIGVTAGDWSPFGGSDSVAYFAPGTMLRIACIEDPGGGWVPQFCGVVESWPQQFVEAGFDSTVTVTAVETTATLSEINDNATVTVGSGDTPTARINRLLTQAEWPYGFVAEQYIATTALQSTDMANNRLGECHLTADSADVFFLSHRSGLGMLRQADPRFRYLGHFQPLEPWLSDAASVAFPMGFEFRPAGVTVTAAGPAFDLSSTSKFLSTPDAANLDITGDITVIVDLDTVDTGTIAAKWGAAGQRSWKLAFDANGTMVWSWSADGTAELSLSSFASQIDDAGGLFAVGFDVNDGAGGRQARFWKSTDEGRSWAQLSINATGASTSIFASTAPVTLGGTTDSGAGPTARYRTFEVRTGIGTGLTAPGGTNVLRVTGEDLIGSPVDATTFEASTGQTVTVNGSDVLPPMEPIVIDAADPFVVSNDLEAMVNDVRFARAGGTQQVAEDATSIGRWKKRISYVRNDLITSTDGDVLTIATAYKNRRSNVTLRPESVSVGSRRNQTVTNLPGLFTVDVGDMCVVTLPDLTTRVRAAVASVTHSVTPGGAATWWRATFSFDVFSEATV